MPYPTPDWSAQQSSPDPADEPVPGSPPVVRVLFVDDAQMLVAVAAKGLPYSGCISTGFCDPAAALARLVEEPAAFDALVTDFSMPTMNGLQLAHRARLIRPDLPVILTSGHLSAVDHVAAAVLGIDAFVGKPCSMNDLAVEVHQALAKRQRASPSP